MEIKTLANGDQDSGLVTFRLTLPDGNLGQITMTKEIYTSMGITHEEMLDARVSVEALARVALTLYETANPKGCVRDTSD